MFQLFLLLTFNSKDMSNPNPTDKFIIEGNNIMKRFFNKPEPAYYHAEEIYKTFFSHNPEIPKADWNHVLEYFNELGATIKPFSNEN